MPTSAIFLFSGEGAHSEGLDLSLLATAPSYISVDKWFTDNHNITAKDFFTKHVGDHSAPWSPVVTTALNILQADLWKLWGHTPAYALGHSIGEIAAAYVSGFVDVEMALRIAYENGVVASAMEGKMVHTMLPPANISTLPDGVNLAAINYSDGVDVSVTLCGTAEAMDGWLEKDETAVELRPKHPWHHPGYLGTKECNAWGTAHGTAQLQGLKFEQPPASECTFISATTAGVTTKIDRAHWAAWLSQPVQFEGALELLVALAAKRPDEALYVIQCAPHPVLDAPIRSLTARLEASAGKVLVAQAASMKRGTWAASFVREQRARLGAAALLEDRLLHALRAAGALRLNSSAGDRSIEIDAERPLADQGVTSAQIPLLTRRLAPFFPGLAPHDLYRFTSVRALLGGWDAPSGSAGAPQPSCPPASSASLDVLGWGLRLPAHVENSDEMWTALLQGEAAITPPPEGFKVVNHAGFLRPQFDAMAANGVARSCGIDGGEAGVIEPQHALALDLVDRMFTQVGPEATAAVLANRERVGVYLGAWQSPADDCTRKSAYAAIGSSLSALAARVANVHNLNGPALTINTACSSALVAVDTALRDARAGRIDYAIVGGVNLIASSPKAADMFAALRRATMLSPTSRCHTFSAAADGYVRAEGGVVFLVRSTNAPSLERPLTVRATIEGTAVNQNTQRKPMTAVDPVAQERVVRAACADAGITPSTLAAVELHGTGTKLGDPVELSALAVVTAGSADTPAAEGGCTLTAAKMHFGHLESAAGGVGMLKACLMLEKHLVPPFEVDPLPCHLLSSLSLGFRRAPLSSPLHPSVGLFAGRCPWPQPGTRGHLRRVAPPAAWHGRHLPARGLLRWREQLRLRRQQCARRPSPRAQ